MYDRAVRRRRAVLVVLVAVLARPAHRLLRRVAPAGRCKSSSAARWRSLAPIQEGANRALKPFRDLFGWFGDTLDAKDERDELEAERDALRQQVAAAPGAPTSENEQLRGPASTYGADGGLEAYAPVDRARLRALELVLVLDDRDQQGLERRRPPRPAGDQRRGPRRQGQDRLGRQRGRDAAHRPGLRRLGAAPRNAGEPGIDRAGRSARPATCCFDLVPRRQGGPRGRPHRHRGHVSTRLPSPFPPGILIGTVQRIEGEGELDRRSTSSRPPTCATSTSCRC